MPWNDSWPVGNVSVRANKITGQENTTYILDTMRIDHYWDESGTYDGRHRHVSMQTTNVDVALPALVGGIMYYKKVSASNSRVEMFYRNFNKIYQVSPSFVEGNHTVTSSFTNMLALPANSYGEIAMYTTTDDGSTAGAFGHFSSIYDAGTKLYAWAFSQATSSSGTSVPIKFANGSDASGLNLRVRTSDATNNLTWNYRITYRGM